MGWSGGGCGEERRGGSAGCAPPNWVRAGVIYI
jgi:hypothetical protein